TFNSKLNLTAPIADWESDGITYSEEFASTELGNCMTSIQTDPSEIEINPGETESIHVVGSDGNTEANIHDYDHFDFEVSDENSIQVASDHDKIDITATESAQDGDVVEVKSHL